MGIIANTAKSIVLAVGLLAGTPGLEGKTMQSTKEMDKSYPAVEQGYRPRPPRECCDPTKYGGQPPQTPPDPKALYLGLTLAAITVIGYALRKKHAEFIENSKQPRDWNFTGTHQHPVVDYEIEREDREA